LVLYPYCKTGISLPKEPENLVQVGLHSKDEFELQPCDRACLLRDRRLAIDVKRFPSILKLFGSLNDLKPTAGKLSEPDGLISFPDLAVCLFTDSKTGTIEFQDKLYKFGKSNLESLRQEYVKLKSPY
jgi:hypothetical protein